VVELNGYGVSQMDALSMSNRLTTEIFRTGQFTVLEREKMSEILFEQGFQQSGCTSSECLVEAGRLLNVQMIVGGSVSKIGNIFTVELRLIDVETGKIIDVANEDIQGDIGEVLTHGIRRATVKLIR
jgi:curli biogenesis system outer membrane secretion channel CsgG